MVKEHRVHRLAHTVISLEGKGDIRKTARRTHARAAFFDFPNRFDEIDSIVFVFFNTRTHSQDIGVKDNILSVKACLLGEYLVGAL